MGCTAGKEALPPQALPLAGTTARECTPVGPAGGGILTGRLPAMPKRRAFRGGPAAPHNQLGHGQQPSGPAQLARTHGSQHLHGKPEVEGSRHYSYLLATLPPPGGPCAPAARLSAALSLVRQCVCARSSSRRPPCAHSKYRVPKPEPGPHTELPDTQPGQHAYAPPGQRCLLQCAARTPAWHTPLTPRERIPRVSSGRMLGPQLRYT